MKKVNREVLERWESLVHQESRVCLENGVFPEREAILVQGDPLEHLVYRVPWEYQV